MLHTALLFVIALATVEPSVTLSGTVVDADGRHLPGAAVVVAEGPPIFHSRPTNMPQPDRAAPPDVFGSVVTDESGAFSISLPSNTPIFRRRLAVWAYHQDQTISVYLIDDDWPRAGLPLRLCLGRMLTARLKITDADWHPVAGARTSPRRVAGQLVPAVLADRLAGFTDAKGTVKLAGVASRDLHSIWVENDVCGKQWAALPPIGEQDVAIVALARVGRLVGRVTADNPRAVRQRKLRFTTWQAPGDESAGGGMAEVVSDDDGKFDIPAIAAGNLTFEDEEGEAPGLRLEKRSPGASPEPQAPHEPAPVYLSEQTTGPQVDAGKTTTFDVPLRRAVAVTQDALDRDDGTPIAGAVVQFRMTVQFRIGRIGARGITDDRGRFVVHLLPGYVIPQPWQIALPYYFPKHFFDGQQIGEETEAMTLNPIHLPRGTTLHGRVVDADHHPVAGAAAH